MTDAVGHAADPVPEAGQNPPGQNPLAHTLHCQLQASAQLAALNLASHGLALAVIAALALYRPGLLLLAVAVIASYWHRSRELRLLARHSVVSLRWHPDGSWAWRRRDGVTGTGALVHATVLGRFFVLLRLRPDGQRWSGLAVPLAGDSLAPASHRRLRVRLTLWSPPRRGPGVAALLVERMGRIKALIRRG